MNHTAQHYQDQALIAELVKAAELGLKYTKLGNVKIDCLPYETDRECYNRCKREAVTFIESILMKAKGEK